MDIKKLKFYAFLSFFPLLRKYYALKIITIAGLGILVPLLVVSIYFSISPPATTDEQFNFLLIISLVTLSTLLLTLYGLYALLRPVLLTATALHHYITEEQITKIPISFEDQAGQLMANVQYVVEKLDLLNRSLQLNSNIDPLTGIQNHRAGEEYLRQDLARARRDESQMLVAMLDIDHFKTINEQFGHHVGDVCLTQIVH